MADIGCRFCNNEEGAVIIVTDLSDGDAPGIGQNCLPGYLITLLEGLTEGTVTITYPELEEPVEPVEPPNDDPGSSFTGEPTPAPKRPRKPSGPSLQTFSEAPTDTESDSKTNTEDAIPVEISQ